MQPQQNALQRINWTTMSYFGKTGRAIRIAIALAAVACGAGCRTAENTSPLPPTKIQQSKFSDYRPQNPFRLSKAGLLERELFVANKGPGYKVELRELLVPPKQRVEVFGLPGSAIVDVRGGRGAVRFAKQTREVVGGAHFAIQSGEAVEFDNNGEAPLVMQVYVFSPK